MSDLHQNKSSFKIPWAYILWLSAFYVFFNSSVWSQTASGSDELRRVLDSANRVYGSSDMLVNGAVYFQQNRMALGSPFLFSPDFIPGKVYVGNQVFEQCNLSYDIVSQELVLKTTMPNGTFMPIRLDPMLVDSFTLNNQMFVSAQLLSSELDVPYALVINEGPRRLVAVYSKQFINTYNATSPQGKFSSTKRVLYLVSEEGLVRIRSKNDLYKQFPDNKKWMTARWNKMHVKFKNISPDQLRWLIDFEETNNNF